METGSRNAGPCGPWGNGTRSHEDVRDQMPPIVGEFSPAHITRQDHSEIPRNQDQPVRHAGPREGAGRKPKYQPSEKPVFNRDGLWFYPTPGGGGHSSPPTQSPLWTRLDSSKLQILLPLAGISGRVLAFFVGGPRLDLARRLEVELGIKFMDMKKGLRIFPKPLILLAPRIDAAERAPVGWNPH